jgi:hypothetical protein
MHRNKLSLISGQIEMKKRMIVNRIVQIIFLFTLVVMISSCIRSYEPEILAADEKKYVITGQLTDEDGSQSINVSLSSPIQSPQYIPVLGCQVNIVDDKGHTFPMGDEGNGNYNNTIDPVVLQAGIAFKIEVTTPEGDFITSDFDTLTRGPEVDSVYYIRGEKSYNPAAPPVLGIQFYLDLDAAPTDSRYYRWEVIETWEYHTPLALEWYYDGTIHHVTPPDSSRMVCWRTLRVPDIFTLTTDNLDENKYDHYSFHFVNNLNNRLAYGYSLLVRQFALSRAAFIYYEDLRVNSNPNGGLYDRQPLAIRGNLHNLTHPEKDVLGFFAASAARSKRIFVYPIPDLPLMFDLYCDPLPIIGGLAHIKPKDYPVYLGGNSNGYTLSWLDVECVNCLSLGGINVKPDFWPN